jgi:UDP-N-acetylmuramate: L-alanyl-gamma-D-glutamyl-meso-diaminopimelate ligase
MFETPRRIHFLGICGTAMGNVAAMMREAGYEVSGSDDAVYPPMSTFLDERGIRILEGYAPEHLDPAPDLCVIGNAMSRGNPEVEAVLDRKLRYLSLPETLREFFLRGSRNVVVTGTHGKTTTTSLTAWLFDQAGAAPSFLIGGIPANFGTGCRRGSGPFWILEGDEYDTAFFDKRSKFIHYLPEILIINNVEFDHADIFPDLAAIQLSFRRLVATVPRNGRILVNADDPNALAVVDPAWTPVERVGTGEHATARITDITYHADRSEFSLHGRRFTLPLSGEFNVRNAAMAVTAALHGGLSLDACAEALASFRGIKRRQEVRAEIGGVTVIDDFGHHPTAIRETLAGLRQRHPGRRIWALFEPRSNTTRRAVFQHSLPAALSLADGVFVAQVARLEQLAPHERLNPGQVVADIAATGRPAFYEPDAATIVAKLVPLVQTGDVITVFSNGGFDGIHARLEAALTARAG